MVLVPKHVVFLTHLQRFPAVADKRENILFQYVLGLKGTASIHHNLDSDSWYWKISYQFSEKTQEGFSSFYETIDDCEREIRRELFGIPNVFERCIRKLWPNGYANTLRSKYNHLIYEAKYL